MMNAPRTLPLQGLALIRALAGEVKTGCFVEIDPLFGSTTVALAQGREVKSTIHSFDTFKSPPWIEKKFGFELNRQLFEKFTAHIDDLTVHEGTIPEIPQDGWNGDIGLLFVSSARSTETLKAHCEFFGPYLQSDAIICGGGFVGRSDKLVNTVYDLAQNAGARLYVFGQFWAFSKTGGARIERAINTVSPGLENVVINATHANKTRPSPASCWSWGVHRRQAMAGFSLKGDTSFDAQITAFSNGRMVGSFNLEKEPVILDGVDSILIGLPEGVGMQFCLLSRGKTSNSKLFPSGSIISLTDEKIVAIRLGRL